mgnify:CR=1 FL=1
MRHAIRLGEWNTSCFPGLPMIGHSTTVTRRFFCPHFNESGAHARESGKCWKDRKNSKFATKRAILAKQASQFARGSKFWEKEAIMYILQQQIGL